MTRYTSFAGSIARMKFFPGGYSIVSTTRVPEPVRAKFRQVDADGLAEIDWNPKTREVKVVPYWERRRG